MRNRYILLADLLAFTVAATGAFVLRFDYLFFQYRSEFTFFLLIAILGKSVTFYGFGIYRRYWRYSSLPDLRLLFVATTWSSVLTAVVVGLALPAQIIDEFSRAVLINDGVLTLLATGGIRMAIRVAGEARARTPIEPKPGSQARSILVAGAGDAGAMVVREIQRNPQLGMKPVGFVDDDPGKLGKTIHGISVLGDIRSLGKIVRTVAVDEVIVAMPTVSGATVRTIVDVCRTLQIPSRTIPGVFELLDGRVTVSRLRHIEISDLLRRPQVVHRSDTSTYVTAQTVLVTGGGGSIGTELCHQVASLHPRRLVMVGHGENSLFEASTKIRERFPQVPISVIVADIRDNQRLKTLFSHFRPTVVFHAAAHKHVHLMEDNFEEAITNNVIGTYNLVEAALEVDTHHLVTISTDKAVSPHGIMGASKRLSSHIVREAGRRAGRCFVAVRFGNVLGSRGSVVPMFQEQIKRGGPITITHPEMKRFFMTIQESVHLVLQAGGIGGPGDLFVLKMGDPVRIIDLAKDLIRLSGFTVDQIPIKTIGIRSGEKVEELLWESDAIVEETPHPEILKVTESQVKEGDLRAAIEALAKATTNSDRQRAEDILCNWIPTFAPSYPAVSPSSSA